MKKPLIIIAALLVVLVLGFVGFKYVTQPELGEVPPIPTATSSDEVKPADTTPAATAETAQPAETTTEAAATAETATDPAIVEAAKHVLQIEVAGQTSGMVEIQLLPDLAPQHVARIEALAEAGGYDGVIFHRVIDGFMVQTGDVEFGKMANDNLERAGLGGSDLPDLKAEFTPEPYVKGVVGMARSQDPDSANSQFFIMFDAAPYLDGQYTVVGRVISGMDVVDSIKKGSSAANGAVTAPADFMQKVRLKTAQ